MTDIRNNSVRLGIKARPVGQVNDWTDHKYHGNAYIRVQ
jgi:hypothetical protein